MLPFFAWKIFSISFFISLDFYLQVLLFLCVKKTFNLFYLSYPGYLILSGIFDNHNIVVFIPDYDTINRYGVDETISCFRFAIFICYGPIT